MCDSDRTKWLSNVTQHIKQNLSEL
jgi:hypothetical protein